MKESIKKLSKQINEEVKAIFTYLHENPELSFKEFNTSLYITEFLKKEEISFERVTETSIIALPDIPALPVLPILPSFLFSLFPLGGLIRYFGIPN